ncbi:MAG: cysteine synthase family protein [Bacteroidetes bacterium]|nr:cysteine synthase family protein [Bacteroidota bacterium]
MNTATITELTELTEVKNELKQKLFTVSKKIGNTPLIPIRHLHDNKKVRIYAKAEWQQLSCSVKARAAFNIIRHAIENGELDENRILLDATSGNTGIAYAAIAKELGLRVVLCLPANASAERKSILQSLGAQIIYTSKFGGTDEAQEVAAELALQNPDKYFYASQYTNEQNWKAHYYGTAVEIARDAPPFTHFVAGLGTTGTFVGTGRRLKEFNPAVQLIALQPDLALHGLEGWKHLDTANVPQIYDASVADRILEVSSNRAHDIIKEAARKEDLLLSPSSAANLAGALQIASEIEEGVIITVLPDNADKYSEIIKQIF